MDDMVDQWHTLGFVVRQGSEHVEVEHCDEASITLLTPDLRFIDVPQGPMGMVREAALAITFEVMSPGSAVTLEYAPGGAPVASAAGRRHYLGDRRPDRAQRRRDGAAVGDLPDRRRPSSIPPQTVTVQRSRLRADLAGHAWTATRWRGRPRRPPWCSIAPAA